MYLRRLLHVLKEEETMTLQEAIAKMREYEELNQAYNHAMGVLSLDGETVAPRGSSAGRGKTLGTLSGISFRLLVNPEMQETFETILAHSSECDHQIVREAEEIRDSYNEISRIPVEEFVAYQELANEANDVWHTAKEQDDYDAFAPYLEKIIDYQRRFAAYKDDKRPAYDVLLDGYEKGMDTEKLDVFFEGLRKELTPVVIEIGKRKAPDTSFLHGHFPVAQQRVFSDKLMALMGLDRNHCGIAETEHPFTTGFGKWDVRITTHYYEHDVASSMYSVIHEGGHAMYELGIADELQGTVLADGASMGIHESQSRFYENLIGRSEAFCHAVLPLMRESFPGQFDDVTPEMLYRAVNLAQPSLIRVDADELTYGNHIMVRYELEKLLIGGDLSVKDLPGEWNRMYKTYLGIDVPSNREGVLQDTHWAGGMMGYFPSYALGSAYGVQMLHAMEKDVDVWKHVADGNFAPVNDWLREKIHRHGRMLTPVQLIEHACGEGFDPSAYTNYLKQKFSALYGL